MKIINKIKRNFVNSSFEEKKKIFYIAMLSFRVFILINFTPLHKYFDKYFCRPNESPINLQPFKEDIRLIRKVLRNLPIKHVCLNESIIVHLYLKKKGIIIPLYLGISKNPILMAHAWYDSTEENAFNQFILNEREEKN